MNGEVGQRAGDEEEGESADISDQYMDRMREFWMVMWMMDEKW